MDLAQEKEFVQGFYTASFGKGIDRRNDKHVSLKQDYLGE